jgi:hypothetical protein
VLFGPFDFEPYSARSISIHRTNASTNLN